jgi:hypothetical protein
MLGNVLYNQEQLLQIFAQPVQGNGLVALAHQLIAAKLNMANGAPHSCVDQTMSDSDALIGDLVVPPIGNGWLDPCDTDALVDLLADYNEGTSGCASHCDQQEKPIPPREPDGCPTNPMTPEQMDEQYRATITTPPCATSDCKPKP